MKNVPAIVPALSEKSIDHDIFYPPPVHKIIMGICYTGAVMLFILCGKNLPLTTEQKAFNRRLAMERITIEHNPVFTGMTVFCDFACLLDCKCPPAQIPVIITV